MKTYSAKPADITRRWYIVDAEGKVLGRLCTHIATILRGKHKPQFTPHMDTGDFVVVINAEKIKLTGDKHAQKQYRRHSGYPGGLRELWYGKLLETHPERAIERAVWGMLPKTTLGRQQLKKLKVYGGAEHPHAAQNPVRLDLSDGIPASVLTQPPLDPVEPKAEEEQQRPPRRERRREARRAAAKLRARQKPKKQQPEAPKPDGGKRTRRGKKAGEEAAAAQPEAAVETEAPATEAEAPEAAEPATPEAPEPAEPEAAEPAEPEAAESSPEAEPAAAGDEQEAKEV